MTESTMRMVAALIMAALTPTAALAEVVVDVTARGNESKTEFVNPEIDPRFLIDVNIDTAGVFIVSAEMRLRANEAGVVTITDGRYGPVWNSGFGFSIPVGPVDPFSGKLGSLPVDPSVTGVSRIVTLVLAVTKATVPGVYVLNVAEILVGDADFQDIDPSPVPGVDFELVVVASGDTDFDQDRDLMDYADFSDCMAGPGSSPAPVGTIAAGHCLAAFDLDSDGDVDAADLVRFQESFTGTTP